MYACSSVRVSFVENGTNGRNSTNSFFRRSPGRLVLNTV